MQISGNCVLEPACTGSWEAIVKYSEVLQAIHYTQLLLKNKLCKLAMKKVYQKTKVILNLITS